MGRERPIRYSEWARSLAGVTEPPEGKKTTGWDVGGPPTERPPAEYFNWHQNNAGQWTKFLDQLFQNTIPIDGNGTDGLECSHNPGVGNEGTFTVSSGTFVDPDGLKVVDNVGDTDVRTASGAAGSGFFGTTYRIDAIVVSANATANTKTYILIEDVVANPPNDDQVVLAYPIVAPVLATYTIADHGIVHTPRNYGDKNIVRVIDGKQALGPGDYTPLEFQDAIDEVNMAGGGIVHLVGDDWGDFANAEIKVKSGVIIDGTGLRQMKAPWGAAADDFMLSFQGNAKGAASIGATGNILDPTIDFRDYGINSFVRILSGPNTGNDYLISDIPSGGGAPGDTASMVNLDHSEATIVADPGPVIYEVYLYKAGIRNLELQCENITLPAVDPLACAVLFDYSMHCFVDNVIIDNLKLDGLASNLRYGFLLRHDNYDFRIEGCKTVQNISIAIGTDVATNVQDRYRILNNDFGTDFVNIAVGAGGNGAYRGNIADDTEQHLPANCEAEILPQTSAQYYRGTSVQTVNTGAADPVFFNTIHSDNGALGPSNISPYRITAMHRMKVRISVTIRTSAVQWTAQEHIILLLYYNGASWIHLDRFSAIADSPALAPTPITLKGTAILELEHDDFFNIWFDNNTASNIDIEIPGAPVGFQSYISVEEL